MQALAAPVRCARTTQTQCVKVGWRRQQLRARTGRRGHVVTNAVHLVVYTSTECPLCEGLREKIGAIVSKAQFMPGFWSDATIEVVDISGNADLESRYSMHVPVLAVRTNGDVVELPRESPRLSADALGKRLEASIVQVTST